MLYHKASHANGPHTSYYVLYYDTGTQGHKYTEPREDKTPHSIPSRSKVSPSVFKCVWSWRGHELNMNHQDKLNDMTLALDLICVSDLTQCWAGVYFSFPMGV